MPVHGTSGLKQDVQRRENQYEGTAFPQGLTEQAGTNQLRYFIKPRHNLDIYLTL